MGALTSKPFAFAARSWELRNVDSFDLFDSFSPDIRIDIRGDKILRIVPRPSYDEWIGDKVRFSYDSVVNSRLKTPKVVSNFSLHYFLGGNTHIIDNFQKLSSASWNVVFNLISSAVSNKSNVSLNKVINFILGHNIGSLPLKLTKEFDILNNFGVTVNRFYDSYPVLSDNNVNIAPYLFTSAKEKVLNTADNIYFVGINIRMKSPLFNAKIRKRVLESNANVILFGHSPLNYRFKVYGASSFSLQNALEKLSHDNSFWFFSNDLPLSLHNFSSINYNNILILSSLGSLTSKVLSLIKGDNKIINKNNNLNIFINTLVLPTVKSNKNNLNIKLQSHNQPSISLSKNSPPLSYRNISILCPTESFFETSDRYYTITGLKGAKHAIVPGGNIRLLKHVLLAFLQQLSVAFFKLNRSYDLSFLNNFGHALKDTLKDRNVGNKTVKLLDNAIDLEEYSFDNKFFQDLHTSMYVRKNYHRFNKGNYNFTKLPYFFFSNSSSSYYRGNDMLSVHSNILLSAHIKFNKSEYNLI